MLLNVFELQVTWLQFWMQLLDRQKYAKQSISLNVQNNNLIWDEKKSYALENPRLHPINPRSSWIMYGGWGQKPILEYQSLLGHYPRGTDPSLSRVLPGPGPFRSIWTSSTIGSGSGWLYLHSCIQPANPAGILSSIQEHWIKRAPHLHNACATYTNTCLPNYPVLVIGRQLAVPQKILLSMPLNMVLLW